MKQLVLCSLFLINVSALSAQSNIYHQFPDSNAVWTCRAAAPCIVWPIFYDYSFVMDGDTIIGGNLYHKIYIPGYTYFSNDVNFCPPFFYGIGYQGAVREDTVTRKVFHISAGDSTENLLFDFNLVVGDTVTGIIAPWSCATVTSIDSVECSDGWRKRWKYTEDLGMITHVIEGIGSLHGFLGISCTVVGHFSADLNCFSTNNQAVYPPDTTSACEIIDGIAQYETNNHLASSLIAPNPFHTTAKLSINARLNNKDGIQLKIFNALGGLVRLENLSVNTGVQEIIIDRGNLDEGFYLYEITDKKSGLIGTGKFMIQ